jgi:hypothetical protein
VLAKETVVPPLVLVAMSRITHPITRPLSRPVYDSLKVAVKLARNQSVLGECANLGHLGVALMQENKVRALLTWVEIREDYQTA